MSTSIYSNNTIPIGCACGARLRARPEQAGRVVRCPTCDGRLLVPLPAALVVTLLAPAALLDDEGPDGLP
jgi:hypothetical protein